MENPFSKTPSLATVREAILADNDLAAARRVAIASAIKVACKWMGIAPVVAPANAGFLREKFVRLEPAAIGVTPKRFSTVKSDVMFALRRTGHAGPGTYLVPMSADWLLLWERLPDKYARTVLSRPFRYFSGRGISPAQVTDAAFEVFERACREETFIRDPRVARQNACRLWNRLASEVNGWPRTELMVPRYADHYILPWSAFPESLLADVESYIAHLGLDDILSLDAPPHPLKPRTVKQYRYELRRFASLLVRRGHDPAEIKNLSYLVQPKHVEDGLRFLLERHGNKPLRSAADLAVLLAKVAKYWVKASPEAVATIRRYARNVMPPPDGVGRKNRERLAPLRDEANLTRLFLLPSKICTDISNRGRVTRDDALLMQMAVAVSILTYAPLRIGNLAGLHVSKNLRWSKPNMQVEAPE